MMTTTSTSEANNYTSSASSEKDQTAFIDSVKNDQESEVSSLISAGVDVNITDKSGNTGLIYAIRNGNESMVDLLIHAGADVNVFDNYGHTALFNAARQDKERLIRALVNAGADVNRENKDCSGTAILCTAINNNHLSLEALIAAGADVNKRDPLGQTPLFYTVQSDNESIDHTLIKAGVDVNITNKYGQTALFHAVMNDKESIVHTLIKAGVDVNVTDKSHGKTALFTAVQYAKVGNTFGDPFEKVYLANERMAIALIEAGTDVNIIADNGQTVLFDAVKNNNERLVCALLEAGADVNAGNKSGESVLYFSLQNDNHRMTQMLIDTGIDVNAQMAFGGCPFLMAAVEDKAMIHALIDAGADVNVTDDFGQTALFIAARNGYGSVTQLLLDAGASVHMTDIEGRTALFSAVPHDCDERLALVLINTGVDVNHTNRIGQTALFDAVQNGHEIIIQALIDAGADVNIADNEGRTALFSAVENNDDEDEFGLFKFYNENVLQTLVKDNNASVNAKDDHGRTPLFYAITKSPRAANYLIKNGANIHLKDNNNMNILSFFVEHCIKEHDAIVSISPNSEALTLLVQQGLKPKSFVGAIIDIVFCISPLVCDSGHRSYHGNVTTSTLLDALTAACNLLDENEDQKKDIIKNVLKLLEKPKNFMLDSRFFDLLFQLEANPNTTDSEGNTALHYVTLLPFSKVPLASIINICSKLEQLGANFSVKNSRNQNPLLFCLSYFANYSKEYGMNQPLNIKAIVEVCRFLIKHGTSVSDTSRNGESVLHLIVGIFQRYVSFDSSREKRQAMLQELKILLHLILPGKVKEREVELVNRSNNKLNTPLHLWAEITTTFDDYMDILDDTTYDDFEELLKEFFKLLLKSGARLNLRNINEETPLHLCKTWCAVKLLVDAGANPNDVDSVGNTALLAAAKQGFGYEKYLYPDVKGDPKVFWKNAIEKKLNPWVVSKQGESVLSILVASENFVLAQALVEVTCDGNYTASDDTIATSLLNAVCRDKSTRTHWKSNLVEIILKASKGQTSLDEPLRLCCKNMVEFGVYGDKKIETLKRNVSKHSLSEFHAHSDDEEQSSTKKHKLDLSTEEEASTEYANTPVEYDSVHCTIAKRLLCYGANHKSLDSSGKSCLDIAENCPALKGLLTKPINIDEIPQLIPWTSNSGKYKSRLAKVARRQECKVVSTLWYHVEDIGSGSFGHVFAGINEKDGREVAIKRIEKVRMKRPEDKREVKSLLSLDGCENIVRYLSITEDDHFSYVVLELMEGDLNSCLDDKKLLPIDRVQLCKDVLVGVQFLHGQNIIHRDLKPSNILYKTHPKLCLKIADFGLSRCIDSTSTTVYGSNVGTRCWIAPEVIKATKEHSTSSDIFSCGLVLHFILSMKKHPFSPAVCVNKSEMELNNETERNVMNGKMEGWYSSLSLEATHLVRDMLDVDEKKPRLTAAEALEHPLFWSREKKMDFLSSVGNQPGFECPRAKRTPHLTGLEIDLEKSFGTVVNYASWNDPGYKQMPVIYADMAKKKKRSYNTKSMVELIRFIRNATAHVSTSSTTSKKQILEDFIFLEYFPNLVIEVFKSVKTHGWDQTREEIKYTMNK